MAQDEFVSITVADTELLRGIDYEIDYTHGLIRLTEKGIERLCRRVIKSVIKEMGASEEQPYRLLSPEEA
jgi:hypothetical protein